ncbi:hypothetical protein CLOM_g3934 [Closterium sp. NIES-68]|nr:hypothetical protein CLOM_g3934 [Closterium sp. NIES-68]
MAAAIRLPSTTPCKWGHGRDASGNCADTCAIRNCGTNSKCLKDETGWANCVCLKGFQLLPNASCAHSCAILEGYALSGDKCIDKCDLKGCLGGTCSQIDGEAVCDCHGATTGLKLLEDTVTCQDACVLEACRTNFTCARNVDNLANVRCECEDGYALAEDGTCIDKCDLKGCLGGTCSQIDGEAVCDCHGATTGLKLLEDTVTCQDKCDLKGCLGGGTCSQSDGVAVCDCDMETSGQVLLADTVTCKDACQVEGCAALGEFGQCIRNPMNASDVRCACKDGYVLSGGICVDACELEACAIKDTKSECIRNPLNLTDVHCACVEGYVLSGGKCTDACLVQACATKDTKSECIVNPQNKTDVHCACLNKYVLSGGVCTDTCALKGCVGGTCDHNTDGSAFCSCNADAGFVLLGDKLTCEHVCTIENCKKKDPNSFCTWTKAGGATCPCMLGFDTPVGGGLCTDTCTLKGCGAHSTCKHRGDGSAFCVCDTGYTLQEDGVTCKDKCAAIKCGGNGTCKVDTAGVASCVCDAGFILQSDGKTCIESCGTKSCDPTSDCVKNAAGVASCVCKAGYQNVSGTCVGVQSIIIRILTALSAVFIKSSSPTSKAAVGDIEI